MRIVSVLAVAWGNVCERVAREKSAKRSRSTTVRPTRPAVRIRRVTRSTSATSAASTSSSDLGERPSARCADAGRASRAGDHGNAVTVRSVLVLGLGPIGDMSSRIGETPRKRPSHLQIVK